MRPAVRFAICSGASHVHPRALPWRGGGRANGFVRDATGIEDVGLPIFSRGLYAQDQGPRGKVIHFRVGVRNRRGPDCARRPHLRRSRGGAGDPFRNRGRGGRGGARQGVAREPGRDRHPRLHGSARSVRDVWGAVTKLALLLPRPRASRRGIANCAGRQSRSGLEILREGKTRRWAFFRRGDRLC